MSARIFGMEGAAGVRRGLLQASGCANPLLVYVQLHCEGRPLAAGSALQRVVYGCGRIMKPKKSNV